LTPSANLYGHVFDAKAITFPKYDSEPGSDWRRISPSSLSGGLVLLLKLCSPPVASSVGT
jgi:hypothetical protein